MPKRTRSYQDWLTPKLADPERAARFLNAALEDSEAMFLKALRKVAASQTRPMSEIAEVCDVSRESLYRMLSESGNPTSENRRAILAALGLKSIVVPIKSQTVIDTEPRGLNNAIGTRSILKGNTVSAGRSERLKFPFSFGVGTPQDQLRKAPMRALTNIDTIGHQQILQTGGGR